MTESPGEIHDPNTLPKGERVVVRTISPNETHVIPSTVRLPDRDLPLSEDIAFLHRFGFGYPALIHAEARADTLNVTPASSLICSDTLSETEYYQLVAAELDLQFVPEPPIDKTPFFKPPNPYQLDEMARLLSPQDGANQLHGYAPRTVYLAPDCRQLSSIKKLIGDHPELAARLRVTTHSQNRQALISRCTHSLLDGAIGHLNRNYPNFSAKTTLIAKQAVVLVLAGQIIFALSMFSSGLVLLTLHLLVSSFYVGCIGLRLIALFSFQRITTERKEAGLITQKTQHSNLPNYSILIALYQEAGQLEDLIDALCQIEWPREKLEVFLICEADDFETINSLELLLQRRGLQFITLLKVPPSHPRTKPKALNFGLPLCKGEYVVVYDAEDRPHPQQLREAYATFSDGPAKLVCLQAPLTILNNRESWLSRLFAIEYSTLFDGLLPALASLNVPLPLGGTSNHFKRKALQEIGGWDPYNVTEDADLGVRLSRAGCEIRTLTLPTYEEAPIILSVWLRQRTRWFKGWYQTWLVHNRHPVTVFRDLGIKGALVFHLMILGMAVSALIHPMLIYFIGSRIYQSFISGSTVFLTNPLFWFDSLTVLVGYLAFSALAARTLPIRNMQHLTRWLWTLPLYWMLLSLAAWRAVWHLIRRPHDCGLMYQR